MINATATVPDQKQTWKSIWPIKILKLIAAIQIIATLGTLGTEAGSVAIHPFLATVYSGFYCSIFFTLAWVSIFTVTCCNQDSLPCAIHTLVQNLLSLGAAIVVIYYANLFINNPYICLLTFTTNCTSTSTLDSITGSTSSYSIKATLNKVQIGCGALMLTTNVVYVIIFIVVTIRVCVAIRPKKDPTTTGPPVVQPFTMPGAVPQVQPGQPAQTSAVVPFVQANPKSPMSAYPLVLHPQNLHLPAYIAQCPHCYGLMRVG